MKTINTSFERLVISYKRDIRCFHFRSSQKKDDIKLFKDIFIVSISFLSLSLSLFFFFFFFFFLDIIPLLIIIIIFYLDIPLYNGGNLSRGNWFSCLNFHPILSHL